MSLWLTTIRENLARRDRIEVEPFADLIETSKTNDNFLLIHWLIDSAWLSHVTMLRDHNAELEETNQALRKQLDVLSQSHGELAQTVSQDHVKKCKELEVLVAQMKEERDEFYRVQAEYGQRFLKLTDEVKRKSDIIEERENHVSVLVDQLKAHQIKLNDQTALTNEKDKTIQILQDELNVLNSEVHKMDEKMAELENENRQLVERWLRKMNEEAQKMNTANQFYETMVETSKAKTKKENSPLEGSQTSSYTVIDPRLRPGLIPSEIPVKTRLQIKAHDDEITSIAVSHDGSLLASSSGDKKVKLFESQTGNCRATLQGCIQSVMVTEFSSADDMVLGASNDYSIRVWTTETGRSKVTLTGHIGNVWAARFNPDAKRIISGSQDRTLKIWDLKKGSCIRTVFSVSSVNDLALTDDSGIITGHVDNIVRFWDAKTGDRVKELGGIHAGQITSVSVSPDKYQVLTSSRDNTLKLVDIRTFEVINTFTADNFRLTNNFTHACFSSDGMYVTCGSQDGTLYIWHTYNGKPNGKLDKMLKSHTTSVSAVAWSPRGQGLLFSGDKSGSLTCWQ